jgi:hypothetical protein
VGYFSPLALSLAPDTVPLMAHITNTLIEPAPQLTQAELTEITSYYAEKGEVVTPEQIEQAINYVAEIMLQAEKEFGIQVSEELVSSWYANLLPEPGLQSLAQE